MSAGLDVHIKDKSYPAVGEASARPVYRDFRLSVSAGSFVCLLGPSGCGKTTLINIVAGLDRDFTGRVALPGGGAARIGYAFQNPRLLPWRTVLENVTLVPDSGGTERALALIEAVGLSDARNLHPSRLSLGMQRRAALARAFSVAPDLLLLDEPFVSLDEAGADRLRDLLLNLLAARPATVLFVTHDSREAVRLSDRIVVLSEAPARIIRDVAVTLGKDDRRNEQAVENFRARRLRGDVAATGGNT